MSIRRAYPSKQDANVQVPEHLNEYVLKTLTNLQGNCPRTAYLKSEVLSKYVSDSTDPAPIRRQRAIEKWFAVEEKNVETNTRLFLLPDEYHILSRVSWDRFRFVASSLIEGVLGCVPPDECLIGQFTGGATTSRSRARSLPGFKFTGEADITRAALPRWESLCEMVPGWFHLTEVNPRVVPGNVLFTVPKTTVIDRCAAKEPDLNMFMQRGVGNYIRKALRNVGINLNDQSINRRLAQEGSRTGSLATLDLSSASDTVTVELVAQLLPEHWYALLADLRSPSTNVDGVEHDNEMFSSMGNGFTFELESLLFWAIAKATAYCTGTRGRISVYGDDIICPTEMAEDLCWVLQVLGFTPNASKSFWTGGFRESCGGHYDRGFDISPFYHREPLKRLVDVIKLANQVRKWHDLGHGLMDDELFSLWEVLASAVPKEYWGGRDYESTAQLVSPGVARRRLLPRFRKVETGVGGLVHWLSTTWDREGHSDGVETSSAMVARNVYRSSRAAMRSWHPLPPLFPTERDCGGSGTINES